MIIILCNAYKTYAVEGLIYNSSVKFYKVTNLLAFRICFSKLLANKCPENVFKSMIFSGVLTVSEKTIGIKILCFKPSRAHSYLTLLTIRP
jgi:hypothetical protein